jgi:hypothetical protein
MDRRGGFLNSHQELVGLAHDRGLRHLKQSP